MELGVKIAWGTGSFVPLAMGVTSLANQHDAKDDGS